MAGILSVARRIRSVVQAGYLGGQPVHIESTYGYDLGDSRYAGAFLNDENHRVATLRAPLAGGLLLDRTLDFLDTGLSDGI